MRSLSAAVSCLLAVVPALTVLPIPPAAGAPAAVPAVGPEVARAAVADPPGNSPAGPQTGPHAVPTKVTELPLPASVSAAGVRPGVPAVLTAASTTAGFQTLGVTWAATPARPDLAISVRTKGATGWSGWQVLDDDAGDDDTATGPGVRGGTDPLWVGPSDGVQARVVVRSGALPKDLRLELVNPGVSGYDVTAASTTPGSTATPGTLVAAGVSRAAVNTSAVVTGGLAEPAILSRAAWGADESRVRDTPTYMPTVKAAVMHHTAGPNNYSPAQVPSIIRGDYAYHLSRGWDDIGYNALVDRFGRIWEGRAGGLDKAVMGAHAGGFNTDTFGVSVIGNYDVAHPMAASVSAVARVMAWKLDLNHRDPFGTTELTSAGGGTARYRAGVTKTFPVIMGHRNTGFTACPGRYLYPYLPSIRRQVKTLMKAALTNPAGPPASVLLGTTVSVKAGSLAAQSWQLDVTGPCAAGRVARITGKAKAGARITASWNGRLADGTLAPAGRYTLTLTSHSSTATARPVVKRVLVVPPAPAAVPAGTPSGGAGGYVPLTPTRLLDTRTTGHVALGPAGRADGPVLGRAGVPAAGVTSVVLNLTATCVSDDTALTVGPAGSAASTRPVTSIAAGGTGSVLVTARVGANGAVSVGNAAGVTQLTVDVVGFYTAGGRPVRPITSTRVYDSRTDVRTGLAGPISAGEIRLIPLPEGLGGVPAADLRAVVLDVSALSPTGAGTVTAYRPDAAGNLAGLVHGPGDSADNLAVVEVSNGMIALRVTGTAVNVALDVQAVVVDGVAGSVAGDTAFTAIAPRPLLNTSTTGGPIAIGKPRRLAVTGTATGVPAGVSAVLLDVTVVDPAASTWIRVYPGGQTAAGTAVRVAKGDTRGNPVVVPVGPDGTIALANARGSAQVRVDVHGYFG